MHLAGLGRSVAVPQSRQAGANRRRGWRMDFECFWVIVCAFTSASRSFHVVVEVRHALSGTITPQNPVRKALEIVGGHPHITFPASEALCRRPGAPQAPQAGAGERRWFLSTSRSLWAAAGRLWRLATPSQTLYLRKIESETVAKRWKSLEGTRTVISRPREHSTTDQTPLSRR